ncbi:hypothetical protein AMTR_s00073p00163500 [Amborella trichopoda]|uniref:VQ domain-containing protein n=2 Tax=Amborella trichopoda TaxID=13333 RepID=W1NNP3_AMBTC|nr:hypothetical protein AMTR_s00073p00163500 [Amborella trichopoda]
MNNAKPQQAAAQPPVYNINKNDFRNVVQRLTGSPAPQDRFSVPPPIHPPKPASLRLQKIRPPPLAPIVTNKPQTQTPPPSFPNSAKNPNSSLLGLPNNNPQARPPLGPLLAPPFPPNDSAWANMAESPMTAYMQYLRYSIVDSGLQPGTFPPPQSPGLPPLPQRLPSPRQSSLPPLLPSPTSQFLLPSPSLYLPPLSPFPLPSPGSQFPPPHAMNSFIPFSPTSQFGIPGGGLPLPPSPGFMFPLSPAARFSLPSPKWRDP